MRRIAAGADMWTQMVLEYYGKEGQAMDEKERLNGVDTEIQEHAEQDHEDRHGRPRTFWRWPFSWHNPMGRC